VLHGKQYPEPRLGALEKEGEHCSMTERRADDATREAIDWLKCEFMMDKVGEEFSGVISGVTGFGFFVELAKVFAEGLVHISTLPNDYYKFDPTKHILQGGRAGRVFRLGDVVEVKVARVDLDQRQIDFVLAGEETSNRSNPRARKDERSEKKKRKKDRKRKKRHPRKKAKE
jgi:ribonuclease R